MVILFYNFVAGQKNCCCREMPVGRILLKKILQLNKNPVRRVGSLGFALGFELFEV
jgi:hypothetical protein